MTRGGGALVIIALLGAVAACGAPPAVVLAPTTTALERRPEPALAALPDDPTPKAPTEEDAPVPITPNDPVWGSRFALVTIVEFGDFQCPFTGRAVATLAELRRRYGEDELRIVWKNNPLPFHVRARPAAEAAMGVFGLGGNAAFWSFHDAAFAHQRALDDASFLAWGEAAGVDPVQLRASIDEGAWKAKVDDDVKLAERLHAPGTPQFFVNGVRVSGAQPVDKFVRTIDEEAKKANVRLDAGASRGRIYVTMTRFNFDGMRENVVDW